jgi:hypothetical protein
MASGCLAAADSTKVQRGTGASTRISERDCHWRCTIPFVMSAALPTSLRLRAKIFAAASLAVTHMLACNAITDLGALQVVDCPTTDCEDASIDDEDDVKASSSSSSSGGRTTKADAAPLPAPQDSGVESGAAPDAATSPSYVIFVTSATFVGRSLGGLAGADAQCQNLANQAKLGTGAAPVFRAWLSSNASPAGARLSPKGPYRDVAGDLIADSFEALKNGQLKKSVSLDETKQARADRVWTGTAKGGLADRECDAWTSSGSQGRAGSAAVSNDGWTDSGLLSCTTAARLYCVEQ